MSCARCREMRVGRPTMRSLGGRLRLSRRKRPSVRARCDPAGCGYPARPATARSISAPAWVRPGWRSRCASTVTVTLVEIDPELAGMAAENVLRNGLGLAARASVLDVAAPAGAFAAAGLRSRLGRSGHDESAVQRSGAAANLARSRRRFAHARRRGALTDWVAQRPAAALHRHADDDLACRRARRSAERARTAVRRGSRCFPCTSRRGRAGDPRFWCGRPRERRATCAAARLWFSTIGRAADGRGRSGAARGRGFAAGRNLKSPSSNSRIAPVRIVRPCARGKRA